MPDTKLAIAVYPRHYLTESMTFVYRQLMAATKRFEPIVLATSTDHLDRYPFGPIYKKPISLMDRNTAKAKRILTRRFAGLSPGHRREWDRILRSHDVKLIHAHFGPSAIDMLPLAMEMNIPLVVTFHGYDASKLLRREKYVRDLGRLFRYVHIITVSEFIGRRMVDLGADPARLEVHYIGVPLDDFKRVSREPLPVKTSRGDEVNILQVSTFVEKKGHAYTIEAFARFLEHYPKSRLVLAGDGPLRLSTEELCRNLGVSDRVTFTGQVAKDEVISLMGEADIFVHHSVTARDGNEEGIPTVIMEAMATGLPVVSTRHAGISELVIEGEGGLLVEEKDVDGYAEALRTMLGFTPRGTEELLASKFNLDRNMEKLMDLYQKLINNGTVP
jgi:glycosyltransferase involved in cell wall biosynthesis